MFAKFVAHINCVRFWRYFLVWCLITLCSDNRHVFSLRIQMQPELSIELTFAWILIKLLLCCRSDQWAILPQIISHFNYSVLWELRSKNSASFRKRQTWKSVRFNMRAEWEKVWSRLSAHLQPFFPAHSAYFNNLWQPILYFDASRQKRILFNCFATKQCLGMLKIWG